MNCTQIQYLQGVEINYSHKGHEEDNYIQLSFVWFQAAVVK